MARLSPLLPLLLILGTLLLLAPPTQALSPFSSTAMSFCKCRCNATSTIIPLYRPQLASNPCLSCTRQFCLDQKLPQCVGVEHPEEDPDTGTGEEGDVEARCFQRDSPKSHFIVISFLVIVGTLLVFAGLKHYGFDLQAIFNRSGVKGVISEIAQFASVIVTRRRSGPVYSSMPS